MDVKKKKRKKTNETCDNMDSGTEERFLAAQAQANEQRLAMEKQMLALQQGFKDAMDKQQREFKRFQQEQATAAAAMGAAAGGVGGRAGGVGGSCGVSEAGSSDTGRGRQKKKARVSGAGGKAAADAGEDEEDVPEEERLPCEYPGCTETFKICSTTRATMSNHMRYNHPQETGGLVLALVCCLHVLACACMCLHV